MITNITGIFIFKLQSTSYQFFYSLNDLKRQREVERVQHENEVSSTVNYNNV